jgi:hypothetical protein
MKVCIAVVMLLLASCMSRNEPATEVLTSDNSAKNPAKSSAEPPEGTWSGDYGPDAARRESIRVELRWEGNDLKGAVHSGFRSMELTKASFQPDTGAITMEFDAQGNGGRTVHYTIEGKVEGDKMAGTWRHPAQSGDFRVNRE